MIKKLLLFCLISIVSLFNLKCAVILSDDKPHVAYVKFLNIVKADILGVGSITYNVRNLSCLGKEWYEEIPYGYQSSLKEISPYSGNIKVTGEIRPNTANGTWISGEWNFTKTINAGDTVLFELTLN
jgi:hypothetical protein